MSLSFEKHAVHKEHDRLTAELKRRFIANLNTALTVLEIEGADPYLVIQESITISRELLDWFGSQEHVLPKLD